MAKTAKASRKKTLTVKKDTLKDLALKGRARAVKGGIDVYKEQDFRMTDPGIFQGGSLPSVVK